MKKRVGIAGFRGYSGAELLRYLRRHELVEIVLIDHRADASEKATRGESVFETVNPGIEAIRAANLDFALLATPPEASIEIVPRLLEAGARVVDLSGAFRLRTPEAYSRWYGAVHPEPGLLAEAVYGLPEFYRSQIANARLVANPGCYPTAANLAIRPLIREGLIDQDHGFVCDAKSGVSGAGRKAQLRTSFCEVASNLSAYAILEHRHVPEILMHSAIEERALSFTAQLIPVERGILETIYFRARPGVTSDAISRAYRAAYDSEPFVKTHSEGSTPSLHLVNYSNRCEIGATLDATTGRGVVVAAIDNLGKGAAGQAIQNLNLMLGEPETRCLI